MTRECEYYAFLRDWSHLGREEPLDLQLKAHAASCCVCNSFLNSVLEGRNLGETLPFTLLSEPRQQAVMLQLMAEAKRFSNRYRTQRTMWNRLATKRVVVALSIGIAAAATTGVMTYSRVSKVRSPESSQGRVSIALPSKKETGGGAAGTHSDSMANLPVTALESPSKLPPKSFTESQAVSTVPSTAPSSGSPLGLRHRSTNGDDEFALAWGALRANRPAQAATQFDALLEGGKLDAARRADVLYWSAQSHHRAGNTNAAVARSRRLLKEFPKSQFAPNAALLLGEVALSNRNYEQARSYLLLAKTSNHSLVRERAERALAQLK